MAICFVTTNRGKYEEASKLLRSFGIEVEWVNQECVEIQSDSLEEIAKQSAQEAAQKLGRPVFVEDAGLFVEALRGFPGPYSSYVYKTIGVLGVLKLMEGVENREAYFESVVAFCDPVRGELEAFSGRVYGRISLEPRGSYGFGYDPIFIPLEGDGRTFAEMSTEEKNALSHRARALRAFANWLRNRQLV